jgi:hypothetical protein
MANKYYKKRIVLVEVGEVTFPLPSHLELKDIPAFLNSTEFKNLIEAQKLKNLSYEDSSFDQKELEIFEERDRSVWKPGTSNLIEDFESLEKYMSDMNNNPKLMGETFYESFVELRNYKEFISSYRFHPLDTSVFIKYLNLLLENEQDFFRNQTGEYFMDCSEEFLEALNQVKEFQYNYDFYDSSFAESINKLGGFIELKHLSWLYDHGIRSLESESKKTNILKQLTILVNQKQSKKLEFLIKNDHNINKIFKEKFSNHPNVTKSITRLLIHKE